MDVDGTALQVGVWAPTIVGAALGVLMAAKTREASLPPPRPYRVRDTVVGAGAVLVLPVAVVVGTAVGMPWGPVAASASSFS